MKNEMTCEILKTRNHTSVTKKVHGIITQISRKQCNPKQHIEIPKWQQEKQIRYWPGFFEVSE